MKQRLLDKSLLELENILGRLDKLNVKALYRQATVLEMQNKLSLALKPVETFFSNYEDLGEFFQNPKGKASQNILNKSDPKDLAAFKKLRKDIKDKLAIQRQKENENMQQFSTNLVEGQAAEAAVVQQEVASQQEEQKAAPVVENAKIAPETTTLSAPEVKTEVQTLRDKVDVQRKLINKMNKRIDALEMGFDLIKTHGF